MGDGNMEPCKHITALIEAIFNSPVCLNVGEGVEIQNEDKTLEWLCSECLVSHQGRGIN